MNKRKLFQLTKGYRGRANNCYRIAYRRVEKALQYSYVGRKLKKRSYRSQWIAQINAGARQYDVTYGNMIHGLNVTGIELNRKMLSQLAIYEPFSFQSIIRCLKDSSAVPTSHYSSYGLLQSATTTNFKPASRQPVAHWNQLPIISNLYYQSAERRQQVAQATWEAEMQLRQQEEEAEEQQQQQQQEGQKMEE